MDNMNVEIAKTLKEKHIAIFGIGGVGGYVTEALARNGIEHFTLVDNDVVSLSNLNRQIIAVQNTVGCYKVDVMKDRILKINPKAQVETFKVFLTPDTSKLFNFQAFDYIIDAIDTVTGKIELVVQAEKNNTAIISSMGTGNKLNPLGFEIADIQNTSICPLARVMRQELRKREIKHLKVLYTKEPALVPTKKSTDTRRSIPGSTSFVPSAAGIYIANEVINDLLKI